MIYLIIYLSIGVLIALKKAGQGKVGESGLLATIFAHAIFWPVVVLKYVYDK